MAISNIGNGVPPTALTPKNKTSAGVAHPQGAVSSSQGAKAHASSEYQPSGASASVIAGAGSPPVDMARIKSLSATIADGNYDVEPEQVATGIYNIELKLGR